MLQRLLNSLLLLLFFITRIFFFFLQFLTECFNHSYLEDSVRGMGFYNGYYGYYQCDRYLPSGWYRFRGEAGTQMPTSCVGKNRCSSHAPGWLVGSHPSVADGVVYATVCFHWNLGCCHWSTSIRVRNCSGFYVYELGPTPACYLRYCGNGGGEDRKADKRDRQAGNLVKTVNNDLTNILHVKIIFMCKNNVFDVVKHNVQLTCNLQPHLFISTANYSTASITSTTVISPTPGSVLLLSIRFCCPARQLVKRIDT